MFLPCRCYEEVLLSLISSHNQEDSLPCCCSDIALWLMDCSVPGFPVLHYHPEFAQTHAHWVRDAIQLYHYLSLPSPFALNLSQHQGLFQWVSSLHQVTKVLEFQLHHRSFQWMNIQDWFPLGLTGVISLQFKGLSSITIKSTRLLASPVTFSFITLFSSQLFSH